MANKIREEFKWKTDQEIERSEVDPRSCEEEFDSLSKITRSAGAIELFSGKFLPV